MAEDLYKILNQKIALLAGLSPKQIRSILEASKLSIHNPGEILCEHGGRSDRLIVLLNGQLEILGEGGTLLATIHPVTTVGEMGFLTRKPRSATVRAQAQSQVLAIDYLSFMKLIEGDFRLQARIYRNAVRLLAERLSDANDLIVRYRQLTADKELDPQPALPAEGGESTAAPPQQVSPDEEAEAEEAVGTFYRLIEQPLDPLQLAEDRVLYQGLRRDGYTAADILYTVKWTVRHIAAARRFNLVKLSIKEAFEDKWSM